MKHAQHRTFSHRRRTLTAAVVGAALAAAVATQPSTPAAADEDGRYVAQVSGSAALPAECGHEDAQPGAAVEPRVAANPKNDKNLVAVWQQDRHHTGGGARATGVSYTFDGGRTWAPSVVPGFGCLSDVDAKGSDPWVSIGPDGAAYVSALVGQEDLRAADSNITDDPNGVVVATSRNGGRDWSPAVHVAPGVSLDKPTVTADPYRAGTAYVVWSQFSWYTCNLLGFCNAVTAAYFSRTDDWGATWSAPLAMAVSPVPLEQMSNPEVSVLPDGTLIAMHVTFEFSYDVVGNVDPCLVSNGMCGRQTIRSQTSTDGGTTWSLPTMVAAGQYLANIADPEADAEGVKRGIRASGGWYPFTQVAGRNGTMYAAWINRFFTAPQLDKRKAELVLAQSKDGGRTWTRHIAMALMSDAFDPVLAISDAGALAVSWYDLGNDVLGDASWSADVLMATSSNGGVTWRRRHVSGPFDIRSAPLGGNIGTDLYMLGDYQGLAPSGSQFVAVFAQPGAVARTSDILAVRVPS